MTNKYNSHQKLSYIKRNEKALKINLDFGWVREFAIFNIKHFLKIYEISTVFENSKREIL